MTDIRRHTDSSKTFELIARIMDKSGVANDRGRRPPLGGDGDREDEEEDDILRRRLSLM